MAEQEQRAILERKMRRAFQVLILQRGRNPGVKGWELKRYLGKDYKKILDVLSDELRGMGLELFQVPGLEGSEDSVRYLLRFREPPTMSEAETAGFRIDDLAVLAASIAYTNAKQGRVARKDLERFLKEKFPRWRVEYSLDRYIKKGYLDQDEGSLLRIGWRTRAEIDEKTLMTLILARGGEGGATSARGEGS
jgi:hypothetical protein